MTKSNTDRNQSIERFKFPDIPGIEMPNMDKVFEEAERSLQDSRLKMEQYRQELEDSGNIRNYRDENGYDIKEISSKDGSFKYVTKTRYADGVYECRTTIWQDGKKIRDDLRKSESETTSLNKNSGGGCLVTLVAIVVIIIAVIGVISII